MCTLSKYDACMLEVISQYELTPKQIERVKVRVSKMAMAYTLPNVYNYTHMICASYEQRKE